MSTLINAGKTVEIFTMIAGTAARARGRVEGTNDSGILLREENQIVFYPWSSVCKVIFA